MKFQKFYSISFKCWQYWGRQDSAISQLESSLATTSQLDSDVTVSRLLESGQESISSRLDSALSRQDSCDSGSPLIRCFFLIMQPVR
jgi:hypothetical protein